MRIILDPNFAAMIGAPTEFDAIVSTIADAVQCLKANFERFVSVASRLQFTIKVGYEEAGEEHLNKPISKRVQVMRFSVAPSGAGTVGRIVLGVALVGLAFVGGLPFLGMTGTQVGLLGGALLLQTIFGGQKSPKDQERDGRKSNVFDRPQQTVTEGGRIPIVYGVHLCGWTIISGKVTNYLTP